MVHFNNEPGPEVPRGPRIDDIRVYRPAFIGMVALVCLPFLVFGSRPAYGWGWTSALAVLWLFLFSFGCVWFMRWPRRLPWLAAIGFLAWLSAVLLAN